MAKYKLQLEDDFDFDLIGICSSHSDYRLSWGINNELNIRLSKADDFSIQSKKDGEHLYSFYEYYDEEEHAEYYLVKNISNNFKKLIPEKEQVDYFLIIKNNFTLDMNKTLNTLKNIDSILTAFIFDADDLKSKANLIF